jgi:hypothetical protein
MSMLRIENIQATPFISKYNYIIWFLQLSSFNSFIKIAIKYKVETAK